MTTGAASVAIQNLLADLGPDGDGMPDGELVDRFSGSRDEDALAALVRRHAPMVWAVCRRLLNHHDAEDAFQATFLVFVRKAAEVPREAVAGWLAGVARLTAVRARATAVKWARREVQVADLPEPAAKEDHDPDLRNVVGKELSHLPGHYQVVIILCDLEGMTRKEAARRLGIPEGSVASRLARARALMAKRLGQRGLAAPGVLVAAALSAGPASASAPPALAASTIQAGNLLAAGRPTCAVSAKVAALAEGVVRDMFVSKIKGVLAVVLLATALVSAVGLLQPTQAAEQPEAKEPAPKDNRKGEDMQPVTKGDRLRVLLVTSGTNREFKFAQAVFARAEQAKKVELTAYSTAAIPDVAADTLLKRFPNRLRRADQVSAEEKDYNLNRYDTVITVDVDWGSVEPESLILLQKWVERGGGLIVAAGTTHTPALARAKADDDALQPLRELLPVVLHGPDDQPALVASRVPVRLKFGENKPVPAFLKLDVEGKTDLAGWDDYFGGHPPQRGFFTCFPAQSLRKGAVTLATFEERGRKDQPWLAAHAVGKGRVIWIGSPEVWRLRQHSETFHERFWLEMARDVAAATRAP